MDIDTQQRDGLCQATLAGEFTIYAAADAKARLTALLEACAEVELDLSAVSEIDTAGFQLLLLIKREAQRLGKTVRFVAHSRTTLELIDLYNMAAQLGDPLVIPAP